VGWLSVNIDFSGRAVLLVGAGQVGLRKLSVLLDVGARVRVVEPSEDPYLDDLAVKGAITLEKEFEESFLDIRPWVFVALDDPAEAGRISALARSRGLMVNSADRPSDCDYIMPALVRDPPFRLTVSTDGASPALSAAVARDLRRRYRGYGALAELLGRLRPLVLSSGLDRDRRGAIFKALAEDGALAERLAAGDLAGLRELIAERLAPVELPAGFSLVKGG
jgi:siroheme synthase-like protein